MEDTGEVVQLTTRTKRKRHKKPLIIFPRPPVKLPIDKNKEDFNSLVTKPQNEKEQKRQAENAEKNNLTKISTKKKGLKYRQAPEIEIITKKESNDANTGSEILFASNTTYSEASLMFTRQSFRHVEESKFTRYNLPPRFARKLLDENKTRTRCETFKKVEEPNIVAKKNVVPQSDKWIAIKKTKKKNTPAPKIVKQQEKPMTATPSAPKITPIAKKKKIKIGVSHEEVDLNVEVKRGMQLRTGGYNRQIIHQQKPKFKIKYVKKPKAKAQSNEGDEKKITLNITEIPKLAKKKRKPKNKSNKNVLETDEDALNEKIVDENDKDTKVRAEVFPLETRGVNEKQDKDAQTKGKRKSKIKTKIGTLTEDQDKTDSIKSANRKLRSSKKTGMEDEKNRTHTSITGKKHTKERVSMTPLLLAEFEALGIIG